MLVIAAINRHYNRVERVVAFSPIEASLSPYDTDNSQEGGFFLSDT